MGRRLKLARRQWTGSREVLVTAALSLLLKSGDIPTNLTSVSAIPSPIPISLPLESCATSLALFVQLATREIQALRSLRKIVSMSNGGSSFDAKVEVFLF